MKKLAKILAALALYSAKSAAGKASGFNAYQPKEPACLKNLFK